MKKILALVVLGFVFFSCTKENEEGIMQQHESINLENDNSNNYVTFSTSIDFGVYLETRYADNGIDYTIVDTESISTEDDGELTLIKIALEGYSMKDVYVAYNPSSEYIKYITEFDWSEGTVENINFDENEIDSFYTPISENIFYEVRAEINPIYLIITDPDNSQNEPNGGPRFFGWTCGPQYEITPDSGEYYRSFCYRAMGINLGNVYVNGNPVKPCEVRHVSNLPGKSPKLIND